MKTKSVLCLTSSSLAAAQIVENLNDEGFPADAVSVLYPDNEGSRDFAHTKTTKAPEGATAGASTGAVSSEYR